ncbi:MAG: tRNA uridine-5-carboxymethylaminomethyl(34) synthesis enzyme MnmG [Prolixibacteraceae bacterium]|jgi:tRNA uridine 5-carboxymethylaminomethyl modification enzyme|nr:tRNA uridine-5-carboxymethylaminomethyl(34) synthesis enzyme MnmG [Prolixibacteraceae bacterium]
MNLNYDVIVVGAGHAGCEAAMASANLGSKVLLITMDMNKIAQMSCNPAMGGIAKGQILREIDAMGGYAGIISDESTIQFRMLNKSKGPAMWSPRAQCDRMQFSAIWRSYLEKNKNIDFWQGMVTNILFNNNKVVGVKTDLDIHISSTCVILTNGTFLNGLMHIGQHKQKGGRISEPESKHISEQLLYLGFKVGRMKTGTPVRIDGRTVEYSKLTEQKGDEIYSKFSYLPENRIKLKQLPCYMAYTNSETHNILQTGFNKSPMFDGTIKSIGPRYCPSIETKLITFSEKDSHHLFLEPEGEDTIEYYLNGFSSSLPWDVQLKALRKIEGFENVKIFRPGYAIEYDYFDPTQLNHTLETKLIKNLYFAGQINGTTGYEEAGAQGLIAGINAHNRCDQKDDFILQRDEAYIGVLIDDLVIKGVDEPYRMFTSRAEYRILLRQDNADERLTPKAFEIGLADKRRIDLLKSKLIIRDELLKFITNFSIKPDEINNYLKRVHSSQLKQGVKLIDIISRPQVILNDIIEEVPELKLKVEAITDRVNEIIESVEIQIKYSGYIDRERLIADKFQRLNDIVLENKFDYDSIHTISTEARQKLSKINPKTIGQASRIPGVSPSDINVLLVLLGR